jgi:type II secretion system protein N
LGAVKKVSKAILVGLAALVVLAGALVAGLNLFVQSPASQLQIQEELSGALRMPLKFVNIGVSPLGRLRITGITIPNAGVNFLEATSFDARFRLLPLLRGRLELTRMRMENPKILWMQSADGKWKLPEPERAAKISAENPPKAETAHAKSPFDVILGRIEVKGGGVDLVDKEHKHVATLANIHLFYDTLGADHFAGRFTVDQLTFAGAMSVEKLSSPFEYDGQSLNLSKIAAALAGGTLDGTLRLRSEKGSSPMETTLGFKNVDMDRLARQLGMPAGQATGLLAGQIALHGDAQKPEDLKGQATLDLRNAQFQQLELFQTIGQVLGLRELSDLRVKDGHGDFRLAGEKIVINKIALNTPDLQLTAEGMARRNKKLNLTAQLSVEEDLVQRLPGAVRDSFKPTDGGRRAINFAITGTVDRPRTDLLDKLIGQKINVQLGGLLHDIFGHGKPRDERGTKEGKAKEEGNSTTPPAEPPPAPAPIPAPQPAAPNP